MAFLKHSRDGQQPVVITNSALARHGRAPVLGAKTASAAKLLIHGDIPAAAPPQFSMPMGPVKVDRATGPPMPMLGGAIGTFRQRRLPTDQDIERQKIAENASCAFREARQGYLDAQKAQSSTNCMAHVTEVEEGNKTVQQTAGRSAANWATNATKAAAAFQQAYDGRLAGMARNREGNDVFEGVRETLPESCERSPSKSSKHPPAWEEAAASRFQEAKAARQRAIARSSSCSGRLFWDEDVTMPELTQKIGTHSKNDGDALEKLVAEARETRQSMRNRDRCGNNNLIGDATTLPMVAALA